MAPAFVADIGRRHRDNNAIELRQHEAVCPPVAPGAAGGVAADFVHPTAVAVHPIAHRIDRARGIERRTSGTPPSLARFARAGNPRLGDYLLALGSAAMQIHLTK